MQPSEPFRFPEFSRRAVPMANEWSLKNSGRRRLAAPAESRNLLPVCASCSPYGSYRRGDGRRGFAMKKQLQQTSCFPGNIRLQICNCRRIRLLQSPRVWDRCFPFRRQRLDGAVHSHALGMRRCKYAGMPFDRRGNKYLGKRAYDAAPGNTDNAAFLFKRFIGSRPGFVLLHPPWKRLPKNVRRKF